jgi:hypothetical protein
MMTNMSNIVLFSTFSWVLDGGMSILWTAPQKAAYE